MRNVECFNNSFITSYGEIIKPTEKITFHFAGAPVGMDTPWTLIHAKESHKQNGGNTPMIAVTVKSANGVVKTFHDDGRYDISGSEGEHNFNIFLNSPLKHNARIVLAQLKIENKNYNGGNEMTKQQIKDAKKKEEKRQIKLGCIKEVKIKLLPSNIKTNFGYCSYK